MTFTLHIVDPFWGSGYMRCTCESHLGQEDSLAHRYSTAVLRGCVCIMVVWRQHCSAFGVHMQLGLLVGTEGIFHYIAFKLRERWGIINTKVTPAAVQAMQDLFSAAAPHRHHWRSVALKADDWCLDLQDGFGTANTALTFHNKQLLALVENDLPYAVRSPDLFYSPRLQCMHIATRRWQV